MSLYHQIITKATGIYNQALLNEIEAIIRIGTPTLDHLSEEELMYEAQAALEAMQLRH